MKLSKVDTGRFNHALGTCMTLYSSEYGYIPISKNASTYCKDFFSIGFNWTYNYRYEHFPKKKFVVCLRDPLKRWVTGVSEYFSQFHNTIDIGNSQILQLISERLVFDEHTEPQVNFITNIDLSRLIFFRVDRNLVDNLDRFVVNELQMRDWLGGMNIVKQKNISSENLDKLKKVELLDNYLKSNLNLMDKIKLLYKEDYNLIENVKFYGE